jgi:hypothetical protein
MARAFCAFYFSYDQEFRLQRLKLAAAALVFACSLRLGPPIRAAILPDPLIHVDVNMRWVDLTLADANGNHACIRHARSSASSSS